MVQGCRPFSELSKSFRIILIAFLLIEKNAKYPRKAGGESINRHIKVENKTQKNILKL